MRSASAFLVLAFWQDGFCWETIVPILFLSLKSWTACSSFPNLSSRCWSGLWGSNLCYLDKLVSVAYSHNQANNKEKKKEMCPYKKSGRHGIFLKNGVKGNETQLKFRKKKKKILAAVISYGKKTNKVTAGGLCRKGVSSSGGIRVLLHY